MDKSTPVYFPSLYDKSVSTFPDNHFNIWKKLGIPSKSMPEPKVQAEQISPWPPGLAEILYDPLRFFSTPLRGDFKPRPSHLDRLCELDIQIKEMELLMITGDGFDVEKYNILKAVKEKMMLYMKTTRDGKKPASAS
ncbi:uncharacterized protein C11orf91 homolog [Mixophyes fleayi]|uniref:uncharacterized protein C11orf91 homolog n=1 Tax=Mixophyes fleayi TaxID=3061075 RepID=UPI003F4DC568